LAETES